MIVEDDEDYDIGEDVVDDDFDIDEGDDLLVNGFGVKVWEEGRRGVFVV